MSRVIAYSDNANHLLKSRAAGYSDGTNHQVKERWVGGADGANHKVWSSLSVGDTYTIGGRDWTVLNIDAATGYAILMCKTVNGPTTFGGSSFGNWISEQNTVRMAMNGSDGISGYYTGWFTAEERAKIIKRNNPFMSYLGTWYLDTSISDYVFALSLGEIFGTPADGPQLQWFAQHNTNAERAALFQSYQCWARTGNNGSTARSGIITAAGAASTLGVSTATGYHFACIQIKI